jgi:hypothetical protein
MSNNLTTPKVVSLSQVAAGGRRIAGKGQRQQTFRRGMVANEKIACDDR